MEEEIKKMNRRNKYVQNYRLEKRLAESRERRLAKAESEQQEKKVVRSRRRKRWNEKYNALDSSSSSSSEDERFTLSLSSSLPSPGKKDAKRQYNHNLKSNRYFKEVSNDEREVPPKVECVKAEAKRNHQTHPPWVQSILADKWKSNSTDKSARRSHSRDIKSHISSSDRKKFEKNEKKDSECIIDEGNKINVAVERNGTERFLAALAERKRKVELIEKDSTHISLASNFHDKQGLCNGLSVARNPIADQKRMMTLAKREVMSLKKKQEHSEHTKCRKNFAKEGIGVSINNKRFTSSNDSLWSDGDEIINSSIDNKQGTMINKRNSPTKSECEDAYLHRSSIINSEDVKKRIPTFDNPKVLGAEEALILSDSFEVPLSINRYMYDYQKDGVRFMFDALNRHEGCILGDDMGLGKTIQIIALLSALLKKTGTSVDEKVITERRRKCDKAIYQRKEMLSDALIYGNHNITDGCDPTDLCKLVIPKWSPILLILPKAVVVTWKETLETWGHFGVLVYGSNMSNEKREFVLSHCREGHSEIMLVPHSLLEKKEHVSKIKSVSWTLLVIDEYHKMKNHDTNIYAAVVNLKEATNSPIIGLTGTAMSNDHKELFNLVNLLGVCPNIFGDRKEFMDEYGKPIRQSRDKRATEIEKQKGDRKRRMLNTAISSFMLRRTKNEFADILNLTTKNEKAVFCNLSPLQKDIYKHVLNLPDFLALKNANIPCDCGINKVFFANYQSIKNRAAQIKYYRKHKPFIEPRKKCCYKRPVDENGDLYEGAVLWKHQHPDRECCNKCPTCTSFAALSMLYKLCAHPCLLQVEHHGELTKKKGNVPWQKRRDFAEIALPSTLLSRMPGGSIFRHININNDDIALSGKMKALDRLLNEFSGKGNRVLIFSHSTTTLDIIQNYAVCQGFTYCRFDGSMTGDKRQRSVDEFQSDSSKFLFLISTTAGGVGLNLTAANKVIIYDVSWNPSNDEQAQDRAFRIGQKRDVDVYRLICRGTVEEQIYARQLYKTHLTKLTLEADASDEPARLFQGVQGDKNKKGELFGLENLLKFKDGSFMADIWKSNISVNGYSDIFEVDNLGKNDYEKLAEVEEDVDEFVGFNHDVFLANDKGNARIKVGDDGFDEELGGESQAFQGAYEDIQFNGDIDAVQSKNFEIGANANELTPRVKNEVNGAAKLVGSSPEVSQSIVSKIHNTSKPIVKVIEPQSAAPYQLPLTDKSPNVKGNKSKCQASSWIGTEELIDFMPFLPSHYSKRG